MGEEQGSLVVPEEKGLPTGSPGRCKGTALCHHPPGDSWPGPHHGNGDGVGMGSAKLGAGIRVNPHYPASEDVPESSA